MKSKFLSVTTVFLLAIFGPFFKSDTFAQVAINEFCSNCSSEWVELYNLTTDPIDIDGWSMLFGSPSQSLVISSSNYPNTRVILPNSFFIITLGSSWMNNGGDTLELFDNTSSTSPIDIATYSGTITSGNTYSRIPDGTGNFVSNTSATQGQNNQPLPTSTPTQAPTPTPTPTAKPNPTATPTTSKSPSGDLRPSPTATPKPPKPSQSDELADEIDIKENEELILGLESPTPTPTPVQDNKKTSFPLPIIAIILGFLLLSSAGFMLIKKKISVSS